MAEYIEQDCMTREDAENMDNEQAKAILIPLRNMMLDQHGCPISDAYFAIDKAIKALDVKPVVHGEWKEYPICDDCYQCSNCGVLSMGKYHFCSNCGARMDEDE